MPSGKEGSSPCWHWPASNALPEAALDALGLLCCWFTFNLLSTRSPRFFSAKLLPNLSATNKGQGQGCAFPLAHLPYVPVNLVLQPLWTTASLGSVINHSSKFPIISKLTECALCCITDVISSRYYTVLPSCNPSDTYPEILHLMVIAAKDATDLHTTHVSSGIRSSRSSLFVPWPPVRQPGRVLWWSASPGRWRLIPEKVPQPPRWSGQPAFPLWNRHTHFSAMLRKHLFMETQLWKTAAAVQF